ncbi:ATP-binding protein [Nocardiopsis eucommiae]|uniref:ATP-binding protein n=1 Tax=Nocardiopsis eucommiae TaxID=2831970 RepID=A0A975LDJ2_9ACTN|nr:ATP-binding protein [Nocardiopsis eucommiae]
MTQPGWDIENPTGLATVVSELATNAIDHTHSGDPGGKFTIRLALHETHIRVTVRDAGPRKGRTPTRRTPEPTAEHGRGLGIVNELAKAWGVARIGTGVWAEVAR